jgi:hypothetical protein
MNAFAHIQCRDVPDVEDDPFVWAHHMSGEVTQAIARLEPDDGVTLDHDTIISIEQQLRDPVMIAERRTNRALFNRSCDAMRDRGLLRRDCNEILETMALEMLA